jgi:hypothetical protein
MGAPVGAQSLQHLSRDRDLPVFAALAIDNPDDAALPVDVLRANRERLADPQPTVVNQAKGRLEAALCHRAHEPCSLLAGHHDRQRLIPPDLKLVPQWPVLAEKIPIKHAQRHHRLVER